MLSEMTSLEVSEWYAYLRVKEQYQNSAVENNQKAEQAKRRAKENNF